MHYEAMPLDVLQKILKELVSCWYHGEFVSSEVQGTCITLTVKGEEVLHTNNKKVVKEICESIGYSVEVATSRTPLEFGGTITIYVALS